MCRVQKPGEVIRPLIIEVFNNGKVSIVPDTMEGSELTIDELAACRDLIDLIIANPKNFHIVKTDEPVISQSCKVCKHDLYLHSQIERDNGLCFDCEKAGILQRSNIQSTVINNKFKKLIGPIDGCTPVEGRPEKICPFCKQSINYTPAYNRGWCMVCKDGKEHSIAEYAALLVAPIDGNAGQSSTMDDLDRIMANEPGYHIDDTQEATEAIPEPIGPADCGEVAVEPENIALGIDDRICKHPGCTTAINKKMYPIRWKEGICIKHRVKPEKPQRRN